MIVKGHVEDSFSLHLCFLGPCSQLELQCTRKVRRVPLGRKGTERGWDNFSCVSEAWGKAVK